MLDGRLGAGTDELGIEALRMRRKQHYGVSLMSLVSLVCVCVSIWLCTCVSPRVPCTHPGRGEVSAARGARSPYHRVPLDNRVKEKWRTEAKSSGSRDSFPGRLGRLGAVMPDAPDAPHLPDKTDCTAFVPFATLITCILLVTVAVAARTRKETSGMRH